MKYKVFVDGQEGTTGLKINEYLSRFTNVELMKIDQEKRKDIETRSALLNEADLVFLCLPDAASRESVSLVNNNKTKIIDASTAFRIDPLWTYGLPELTKDHRERIRNSSRVSVPGCHATGFILAIRPLVSGGIIPTDYPISSYSITGYSGGGKKLISKYEESAEEHIGAPKHYALSLSHKHIPEMQIHTGLSTAPLFTPIVANYYQGIAVSVPLFPRLFNKRMDARDIRELLANYYRDEPFIRIMPYESGEYLEDGYFNIVERNKTNGVDIFVFGQGEQVLLVSRFDNLGKGASGAAIQNMNIMLGFDEGTGLDS